MLATYIAPSLSTAILPTGEGSGGLMQGARAIGVATPDGTGTMALGAARNSAVGFNNNNALMGKISSSRIMAS
ncbi:hypothetical protein ACJ6TS_04030 [Citrobacter telavivensis]